MVADAQPQVTVDVLLPASAEGDLLPAWAAAIPRRAVTAADPRTGAEVGRHTEVDRRTAVAAADMGGNTLRWIRAQHSEAA